MTNDDDPARAVAADIRAKQEPALLYGTLLSLEAIDDDMGGADTWDKPVVCEGVVFAVVAADIDGQLGIGVQMLPDLSTQLYHEAHDTDDTGPGATGRALSRVVLAIHAGRTPPDLAALIHADDARIVAVGFASEVWMTNRPAHERGPTRLIRDEPDRVEARVVHAVDIDDGEYVRRRIRGEEPVQSVWPPRAAWPRYSGPIQQALRVLARTVDRQTNATTN